MNALLRGALDFLAPTHLLVIVALGLVGQPARFPVFALCELAAGLLIGSLAIAFGIGETPAATALLTLAVITGAILIAAWQPPTWLTGLLAFAIGIALALNAPPHAITIVGAVAAQVGFALAALVIFSTIALAAMHATRPWQRIGVRIVGSWIAASAVLVLVLRLAR
jgi:urease accessory protein